MSNSKMRMNTIDAGLLVLGVMTAFILVGIGSFDLFGVDFSAEITEISGIGLSTAWVLGYAAILGTILTNDNAEINSLSDDVQNLSTYYMVAVVFTLAMPVLFVVFPEVVGNFFQSEDLWGVVYVVLVTTGQAALGWML